jgi:hypothetical protein
MLRDLARQYDIMNGSGSVEPLFDDTVIKVFDQLH